MANPSFTLAERGDWTKLARDRSHKTLGTHHEWSSGDRRFFTSLGGCAGKRGGWRDHGGAKRTEI